MRWAGGWVVCICIHKPTTMDTQTFKDLRFGLYTLSDTGIGQIGEAYYPGPIDVKARRTCFI